MSKFYPLIWKSISALATRDEREIVYDRSRAALRAHQQTSAFTAEEVNAQTRDLEEAIERAEREKEKSVRRQTNASLGSVIQVTLATAPATPQSDAPAGEVEQSAEDSQSGSPSLETSPESSERTTRNDAAANSRASKLIAAILILLIVPIALGLYLRNPPATRILATKTDEAAQPAAPSELALLDRDKVIPVSAGIAPVEASPDCASQERPAAPDQTLTECAVVQTVSDPAIPVPTIVADAPDATEQAGSAPTLSAATLDNGRPAGCLSTREIEAQSDPDFLRNVEILRNPALCVSIEKFSEASQRWTLQIVKNLKRPGPLWAVPHDDEDDAFSTGVYAALNYGGVLVAVEAGEARLNGGQNPKVNQDPDRNFGAPQIAGSCPGQIAPAPEFTRRFMRHAKTKLIVALHNTLPARSANLVDRPSANETPFMAPASENATRMNASPKHMIYFAGKAPAASPTVRGEASWFNAEGINVIYENISNPNNFCALSRYSVLRGGARVFGIDSPQGEPQDQLAMLQVLMRRLNIAASPSGEPPSPIPIARPRPSAATTFAAKPADPPSSDASPAGQRDQPIMQVTVARPRPARPPRDIRPVLTPR